MTKLWVSEIFGPTLQGEGSVVGLRTMFVRLGGCDGADGKRNWCAWCDSMFAVDPVNKPEWRRMDEFEILHELGELGKHVHNVTITGGNPGLYDLTELIRLLHDYGWHVNVETQATVFRKWMADVDYLTLSPKPPSAYEAAFSQHPQLRNFELQKEQAKAALAMFHDFMELLSDSLGEDYAPPEVALKVVIQGDVDAEFAQLCLPAMNLLPEWVSWHSHLSLLTLPTDTAESLLERYRFAAEHFSGLAELADFRLLPQMHVLLWEHKRAV